MYNNSTTAVDPRCAIVIVEDLLRILSLLYLTGFCLHPQHTSDQPRACEMLGSTHHLLSSQLITNYEF